MDRAQKQRELEQLRAQVARLEAELLEPVAVAWPPRDYYTAYHVLAGMVLGLMGACASLLFNVIGSAMVGQSALQLIKVYLTFPLGERGLSINDGFALAGGCGLYLCTGAVYGVPFHMVLSRWFAGASLATRFMVVTAMGMGLWVVNFYLLILWLQPLLIGGNWILDGVPWWVAGLTHLVFAWTMLAVDRWGAFAPYRHRTAEAP